ncbi:hypothetical protein ANCCAN_07525 [Ancylostoma caninum]|uniref:Tc1-like transposase DDE domain-containing protein n=1 Tax=Ancylostoma caninum TaxID=29170 RepID=A0A368GTZ8_ANCCA|nr:hypothetical protein ANCCAN_07525 [Ancylostoma caninum]
MHEKLVHANPAVVNRKGPILLRDNARPHVSRKTLQKLKELGYEGLPHPAYPPNLFGNRLSFFQKPRQLHQSLPSKEITKVEYDEGLNEVVGIGSCVEIYADGESEPVGQA